MCDICDGKPFEGVLEAAAADIRRSGFVVVSVEDAPAHGSPGWVYTVGLIDSADHPELIVAGAPIDRSARLVQHLATAALDGERFEVGDAIDVGGGLAEMGAVHELHFWSATFMMWHNLAEEGLIHRHSPSAVQVIVPPNWLDGVRTPQPALSDPAAHVSATHTRPNRAARRARSRRR